MAYNIDLWVYCLSKFYLATFHFYKMILDKTKFEVEQYYSVPYIFKIQIICFLVEYRL